MKRKSLLFLILLAIALFAVTFSLGESTDPIKATIQYSPTQVSGIQDIEVNITITNVSSGENTKTVTLYSPDGKRVLDFGENGDVVLTEGSSKTYSGKWTLSQSDLEKGEIKYYIRYPLSKEDGTEEVKSKFLAATFESAQKNENGVSFERVISPLTAPKGQEITIDYIIVNNSGDTIKNIKIQENKAISKDTKTLATLAAGEQGKLSFTTKMGTKNLKSHPVITYRVDNKVKKVNIEDKTISYGEAKVNAKLTLSDTGVLVGSTVKLSLDLNNTGTIGYSNVVVSDSNLGELFSGENLPAGASLHLEKDVVVEKDTSFNLNVVGIDESGSKIEVNTGAQTVRTITESQQLSLSVNTVADKEVFYDDGGRIKFTISVSNNSLGEAKNVAIYQRDTHVYTFQSIAPGQTKSVARDFTLSQSGKYRFDAKVKNVINEDLTFNGNELYIEVIAPTAVPVIITPSPLPPLVTIAPKQWSDAPESFANNGRTLNTLTIVSLALFGFFAGIALISLALRGLALYKSNNAKGNIKTLKNSRNYYKPAETKEEVQTHEPQASIVFEENDSPYADVVETEETHTEDADTMRTANIRRRSPGDSL